MIDNLIWLPVILPFLLGVIISRHKNENLSVIFVLVGIIINGLIVIFNLDNFNELVVLTLNKDLYIYYVVDDIGGFFATAISIIWVVVGVYAVEYIKHEQRSKEFMMWYTMSLSPLISICFSGNLITLYTSFEIMTIFTFPLVMHNREPEAVRAGIKYIGYSILGAGLVLFGFLIVNEYSLSTDFIGGGINFNEVAITEKRNLLLVACFSMIVGFSCKGGMFPLHNWLPTAHPVAPSVGSAVLSGVITKIGVLCVIRVIYFIFGGDFIKNTWVQNAYLVLAIITIIIGSTLAYKEKNIKKRLAYSTMSQLSYILFGIMLLNYNGMVSALLQVVFHMISKNLLFMCVGGLIMKTGYSNVRDYNGIGKELGNVIILFTIGSLSLIGIPPFAGFISKFALVQSAFLLENKIAFIGSIALMVSALLTAGYLLSFVYSSMFLHSDKEDLNLKPVSSTMILPIGILAFMLLYFGIFPNGLQNIIKEIINSSNMFRG